MAIHVCGLSGEVNLCSQCFRAGWTTQLVCVCMCVCVCVRVRVRVCVSFSFLCLLLFSPHVTLRIYLKVNFLFQDNKVLSYRQNTKITSHSKSRSHLPAFFWLQCSKSVFIFLFYYFIAWPFYFVRSDPTNCFSRFPSEMKNMTPGKESH